MKVIFIIENMLGVTGGNITLNKIIKYLVCRDLDILILTRSKDYVPIDGVRVSTIPLHESFSKNCPECDIVIATYFSHVHELLDIKANKKIYYAQGDQFVFNDPMLIDERNPALSVNNDLHKLSSMSYGIEGIIYILNSRNLANTVMSKYGCREPEYIVPVGTDAKLFYPAKKEGNKLEILVVGPDNLGDYVNPLIFKGIKDIKKALEEVIKKHPDVVINRISGTHPEIFKDFKCNYFQNPEQKDLAEIYRRSHILIYGSRYDSCPRPPQEGMASGCAVICTDTAGAREYCVDNVNSILVPAGDVLEMSHAIEKLITDVGLRFKISKNGINTANEYTFKDECNLFFNAINDVLSKPAVAHNKLPKVATIGVLKKLKDTVNSSNKSSINEFINLLNLRPFHPEAYLQLIDISLENNLDDQACFLAEKLLKLTPKWDVANKLYKSFHGKDYSENNVDSSLKQACLRQSRLTCCIIAKNEEPNIGRCLRSIQQLVQQVIVLDTGSTDDTKKIAATHGAEIYDYEWKDNFSEARNKCLEYARGDWIIFLDADEELDSDAVKLLKEDMSKPNVLGYRLPLRNVGTKLNGCNYVPRLVRNAPGLHFIGKIHETIHASVLVVMNQWGMEQIMGKTKILHHGYHSEELVRKNKLKRNLALYEEALEELPDEPSIMMNYAHDLNHDGQTERAHKIYRKILKIFEKYPKEQITPEVREQFIHNYGVFLAQHQKMEELIEVMSSRTARETGPVANVHYMSGVGLMNCKRYREAISELEDSIKKAYDESLAPSVPDIRTWKPKHLLANSHASIGNELQAIQLWEEVIAVCGNSTDPFHDYAKYLSTIGRNREALEVLLKGLEVEGDTRKIWELGCGIVNKDPEIAQMSLEWTGEAVKHHPESEVTNVRRGEALMKNGKFAEATEFFSCLSDRDEKTATAAKLICRQLSNNASESDREMAKHCADEVNSWFDVLEKAPCEFDRELAEQLIR